MATERIMPAVALPSPARPRPVRGRVAGPMAHPVRPAVRKKEAVLSTPTRAGMLIGASAAIYAVSLATVSGLQYQSQADLAAQHQPMLETIVQAKAANDALEATIQAADARARALANDYTAAGGDVTAYQARLDQLAALVAKVQGSAAALSTSIRLPTVTMHGAIGGGYVGSGGSAPATGGTTAASGKP